ncbi:hypothetical protein Sjap_000320 [Stephania japonica]|uniref:Uncharacterized protein n=1 Tax=Stephania japonica TaxID=461633 RepID=A0AAP0KIS3_9MAGN
MRLTKPPLPSNISDNPMILEDGHEETLREKEVVREKETVGEKEVVEGTSSIGELSSTDPSGNHVVAVNLNDALPRNPPQSITTDYNENEDVDVFPTDKGNHGDLNDSLPCTSPIFNSLDQNENEGAEVSLIKKPNNHGVEVKFNDPTVQTEEQEDQVMQHTNEELIVEDQVMQQTGGKLLVEDHSGYQIPVVNEADQGSISDITDVDILPPIATAKLNTHAKEANISKFSQTSSGPFEVQHLMQRLKSIEEGIQEVKEALQQTNTTLKNEMSAMMWVKCSMLKEEPLNFFTHAMDKIEDRFRTRMVHNFRLVEDHLLQ